MIDLFAPEMVIAIVVGIIVHWIFTDEDDPWTPPFRRDPQ